MDVSVHGNDDELYGNSIRLQLELEREDKIGRKSRIFVDCDGEDDMQLEYKHAP